MAYRNDFKNITRKARFFSRVDIPDNENSCWEWGGSYITNKVLPYGQFYWGVVDGKEKSVSAHRASYLINIGEIQKDKHILHKCNNSKCVNPNHLYQGDIWDNMRDRDTCGHTSKGAHRYNFLRTPELTEKIKEMRNNGIKIKDIMKECKVSRNTVYRCLGVIKDHAT